MKLAVVTDSGDVLCPIPTCGGEIVRLTEVTRIESIAATGTPGRGGRSYRYIHEDFELVPDLNPYFECGHCGLSVYLPTIT